MHRCRIQLDHSRAQEFFDSCMHPDIDELERRDTFLAEIARSLTDRTEGDDLVEEIPNIDISSLMQQPDIYASPVDLSRGFAWQWLLVCHYGEDIQQRQNIYSLLKESVSQEDADLWDINAIVRIDIHNTGATVPTGGSIMAVAS